MVIEKSSNLVTVMVAAIVMAFASLEAAPLFAAGSVPPANFQEVNVPGTHPLDASAVDLGKYGYVEQEYYASGTANRYRIKNPLDTASVQNQDYGAEAAGPKALQWNCGS